MDRIDPQPHRHSPGAQGSGFRIMRETEIAPGWWATPTEIGETGSATVADTYCTQQNKVTDDPNRQTKRHRYFAEPILDEAPTPRTAPLPLAGLDALDRAARALQPSADAVYETAGRYLIAEQDYRRTAATADYDACLTAQDEMAMCACQLADAGRLDLIGAGA